jgi:hypothetical protein
MPHIQVYDQQDQGPWGLISAADAVGRSPMDMSFAVPSVLGIDQYTFNIIDIFVGKGTFVEADLANIWNDVGDLAQYSFAIVEDS